MARPGLRGMPKPPQSPCPPPRGRFDSVGPGASLVPVLLHHRALCPVVRSHAHAAGSPHLLDHRFSPAHRGRSASGQILPIRSVRAVNAGEHFFVRQVPIIKEHGLDRQSRSLARGLRRYPDAQPVERIHTRRELQHPPDPRQVVADSPDVTHPVSQRLKRNHHVLSKQGGIDHRDQEALHPLVVLHARPLTQQSVPPRVAADHEELRRQNNFLLRPRQIGQSTAPGRVFDPDACVRLHGRTGRRHLPGPHAGLDVLFRNCPIRVAANRAV